MLIVAGHLDVDPGRRDAYVASCVPVVEAARAAPGCLAFSVSADTVEAGRVLVYERWEDEAQLLAFRGSGPSAEQEAEVLAAQVLRYEVAGVADA